MTAHDAPEPQRITPAPISTKERKEATAKRIKEEAQKEQAHVAGRVVTDNTARRHKWDSLNPNDNYLHDYASGFFGKRSSLEMAIWDQEAHEDAVATFEGYCKGPQPWKGARHRVCRLMDSASGFHITETIEDLTLAHATDTSHWEPTADQQSITVPEPKDSGYISLTTRSSAALKATTPEDINAAYEAFASNPEAELSNLQVSLYAFAPTQGRLNRCKRLLWDIDETDLRPEDIMADFVMDLLDRFGKGQYHTHDGRFHHWIGHVWGKWFFPSVQEKVKKHSNMTIHTDGYEFEENDETETERNANAINALEVDTEIFQRNTERWTEPSRLASRILSQLDDQTSVYGSLNETAKMMLRDIARGATKQQAAKRCGISERSGRRLLADVLEKISSAMVNIHACADEPTSNLLEWPSTAETFDIQGCADSAFEPLLGVEEAAKLLCVHPKTLQALARAGTVPCTRMGKYWRFRASVLDTWVRDRLEFDHQSRRVS